MRADRHALLARQRDHISFDLGDSYLLRGERSVKVVYAANAPEQIHSGGAGCGEVVADLGDLAVKFSQRAGRRVLDPERHTHRSRNADRHGSANDHVANDGGNLLVVGCEDVGLLERQLGLVKKTNAGGGPFKGRDHLLTSLPKTRPCVGVGDSLAWARWNRRANGQASP